MQKANWIRPEEDFGDNCPLFRKDFSICKEVKSAVLSISAKGVYEAFINGSRVGDYFLPPGKTLYEKKIQYQEYDVTELLKSKNSLIVQVANGWYRGRITWPSNKRTALIAKLSVEYTDGKSDIFRTDTDWLCAKSGFSLCDFYDGFIFDANYEPDFCLPVVYEETNDKSVLVPQMGEKVIEQERICPVEIIRTPKGETVIDFGQNHAGYVEINLSAKKGDRVALSFAEILDKDGNFYNENYRSAKCQYIYTCRDGKQTFKPTLTFYGYRYVRVDEFPCAVKPDNFTSIAVYSEMKRTGRIESSNALLTRFFKNVIWSQRSNFLDIPTDCPQRDERKGWTGDAQMFCKTASYNYDVYKFFYKWLDDMALSQMENGVIPEIVPNLGTGKISAAWADAVAICPWQMYLSYGNAEILRKMFPAVKRWVNYVIDATKEPYLWVGGDHYGDWLELKAPKGSYKGETRDDLVASAFHAHTTKLLCKMGNVLGEDVSYYEEHYKKCVKAFCEYFKEDYKTQTEYVLSLYFDLTAEPLKTAARLVELVHQDGDKIQTGFVGTPYILHVLSKYGYNELAYKLMLRDEYPSWLYPVTMGATTTWEHWDGIMPSGELWPVKMNSYNHYAYGAVVDWLYEKAAGINTVEDAPGFAKVHFTPVADDRIDWFRASIETAFGTIKSGWRHNGVKVVYEIETPVYATAIIEGKAYSLGPGKHVL